MVGWRFLKIIRRLMDDHCGYVLIHEKENRQSERKTERYENRIQRQIT